MKTKTNNLRKKQLTKIKQPFNKPLHKEASYLTAIALLYMSAAVIIFSVIARQIRHMWLPDLDNNLLLAIRQMSNPGLDNIMVMVTHLGGVYVVPVITIVVALFLLAKKHPNWSLRLLLGVGGASLIAVILKVLFQRDRPNLWDWLVVENTYSFPSGHAMVSMALAFSLVAIAWRTKLRLPAIILGTLYVIVVGFTRLYLGVHYPSDVLAGWLAASVWVIIVGLCFRRAKASSKAK